MRSRSVGAELFYGHGLTDGQTNMAKLIVAFHEFISDFIRGMKLATHYFTMAKNAWS